MEKFLNRKLQSDPRVQEAKRLLTEVLQEQQRHIQGPREVDSARVLKYQELLTHFEQLRGGKLYYPYLSTGVGKGALVELADGSVKYDFITGVGVHYLGHSHPKLLAAGVDAALEDTTTQGNLQQSAASIEFLELLLTQAKRRGAKLKHGFLTSSGAMANENAIKMIFQKHSPANRILAFERCFAGRSMVLCQITDKPANREGLPKVLDVDYVPFFDPQNPQESIRISVEKLQQHLHSHPGQHAGMMFELIQGEGGYYPGSTAFFVALMEILKKHHIAILVDEIQTFGRTTELFAFQYFGLDEYVDVVTIGKMTQTCVTLFTDEYKPKPGLISQTFTATSSSIHAGLAIVREVIEGNYLGNDGKIARLCKHFTGQLALLTQKYPGKIYGPFGFGVMVAITVFDGSEKSAKEFLQQFFKNGVIAFIAGHSPARIRFLIPVGAVTTEDIDCVCRIIERTLADMSAAI